MKRFLSFLIFAVVCSGYVMAYDFSAVCESGQTLYYNITSSSEPYTVEVVRRYTGGGYGDAAPSGNLVIPEIVTYNDITYSVTSIGSAFSGCSGLTSVTIPNTVTSIGGSAFSGCNGLISFTIPNSVTSIGGSAFEDCSNLTSITIPESVASIGYRAFYACSSLAEIIIPESVISIGKWAFSACSSLNEITIPNSSIGERAFEECVGLSEVTIGSGVTSIEGYAFLGCNNLTTVNFNATNCSVMGTFFYEDGVLYNYYEVFKNCPSLTFINIGDNVINIPINAFKNCSSLIEVALGNSVTTIGNLAFDGCTSLTEIALPSSVTSIGSGAFYRCTGLSEIALPSSVTSIGDYAFWGHRNLTNIYYAGSVEQWCRINFGYPGVYSTDEYGVSDGVNLYINDNLVTDLVIPESITEIKDFAFCGVRCVTSVTIPNSVTSIGNGAFGACGNNLRSVTIGNSVARIGVGAFDYALDIHCTITLYAEQPPELEVGEEGEGDYVFGYLYYVTLYVPCATKQLYIASAWNIFNDNSNQIGIIPGQEFQYTVSANVAESCTGRGNVEVQHNPDCEDNSFIVEAIPIEDYRFVRWNDGDISNPRTVIVTSDIELTAEFAYNRFEIEVTSNNENMGTVEGNGVFGYGDMPFIEANANDGYIFVHWNDGNTENPRQIFVERDSSFIATFGILNEMTVADCNNYDLGGGYDFYETGTHYGFYTNAEGIDSVVRLNLTIEQPLEPVINVVSTNGNNKNVVMWNPVSSNTMLGYLVYRQNAYGQYEIVDTVAIDAECSWTDEASNTAVRPYRYAVATYDSCGNVSEMSVPHRTIHLQISLGQDNIRNLSWTDYEGVNFSTYRVYRGTTVEDLEMIADMSRENHTYTDLNTEHDCYYQIEIVSGRSLVTSRSNIFYSSINAIETEQMTSEVSLFPNPVADILNITSSETISEIEIVNVIGQVVKRIDVNADNVVCNVEDLKAGVYVVRIRTLRCAEPVEASGVEGSAILQRKFIKE